MSERAIGVEWISVAIALFLAVGFVYGYHFQSSFYSEFDLSWYVAQLPVSYIAMSSISGVAFIAIIGFFFYLVCDLHERVWLVVSGISLVAALSFSMAANRFRAGLHESATAASQLYLDWRVCFFLAAALCLCCVVFLFVRGHKFMFAVLAFSFYTVYLNMLPSIDAQVRAVRIVTGSEEFLPVVTQGEYKDWKLLSVNGDQALLIKFDREGLESYSRVEFTSLLGLKIKTAQRATHRLVPFMDLND